MHINHLFLCNNSKVMICFCDEKHRTYIFHEIWCCELKHQELGLPCPEDRVLLCPRHSELTSQHLVHQTHSYCDVFFFFSYVNNAASVCLSLHMVCAAYICRRQGINYYIPSYFYLISLHTPPFKLLLPHTFVFYTIYKPPTTFFDVALCPDMFVG